VANRSEAGELDVVIYSTRKWARLPLGGNPTVLLLLFVPEDEVVSHESMIHSLTPALRANMAAKHQRERY
jgi:predicted nucleotidyltransferase